MGFNSAFKGLKNMLYKIRKEFNINSVLNVRSEFFEAMNIYIVFACVLSSMIKTEAPSCS